MEKMIPFSRPTIGEEEIEAVKRVIDSGWIASGPETEKFEREFADYVGVKYAIFTNSGTSALKMAYKYFMENENKLFYYCPKNTFCATYSAAEEIGLKSSKEMEDEFIVKVNVHYGGVKDENKCDLEDSAHLYPYMTSNPIEVYGLRKYLYEQGISSGYHYPGSGWLGVSLPLYPTLTDKEIKRIINTIKEWRD